MKFVLAILVCFLLSLSIVAQTENSEDLPLNAIEKLTLAREDKEGNIEENIVIFRPTDIPIYCYIDLKSKKAVMVKMNLVAVKAKGLRENAKVVVVSYKTKDGESIVRFNASPEKVWTVGDYRVDILLNGKLSESLEFKVEKEK